MDTYTETELASAVTITASWRVPTDNDKLVHHLPPKHVQDIRAEMDRWSTEMETGRKQL